MERICSSRSKFSPLRVDSFLKGLYFQGKKRGSNKDVLLLSKWRQNIVVYQYTLHESMYVNLYHVDESLNSHVTGALCMIIFLFKESCIFL